MENREKSGSRAAAAADNGASRADDGDALAANDAERGWRHGRILLQAHLRAQAMHLRRSNLSPVANYSKHCNGKTIQLKAQAAYCLELVGFAVGALLQVCEDLILILEPCHPAALHIALHLVNALVQHLLGLSHANDYVSILIFPSHQWRPNAQPFCDVGQPLQGVVAG